MKTLRLIVSMRLAFFPLVFNLSIAQEVEVTTENPVGEIEGDTPMDPHASFHSAQDDEEDTNNNSDSVLMLDKDGNREQNENEEEPGLNGVENIQDSSLNLEGQVNPENDKDVVPLYERGYGEAEGIFSKEEEKILSPSDSSFTKEQKKDQSGGDAQLNPVILSQNDDGNDFSLDKGVEPFTVDDLQIQENETLLDSSAKASEGQAGGEEQNTQDSSPQTEGQDLPNLVISEVYRLGSTERIEITNLSDKDFSGKLSLSGVKKQKGNIYNTKKITIPAYSSVIISDKLEIGIENNDIIIINDAQLTIDDSSALYIQLQYSGNIIDSFNVDESIVDDLEDTYKNKIPRPSFQKFFNDGREVQIATEADIYNISGFVANPGMIVIKNGNPWIGDGPSVYPPIQSGSGNGNDSGNSDEPGNGGNSGSGDNPGSGNVSQGSSDFQLIISEVYYDDEDEWIEIYNIGTGDFFGDLILSGNIYGNNQTSFDYQNIQIPANDFIIFADSDEMFQNINVLVNGQIYPEFSISDGEKIDISLVLSGEVIDSFFTHQYRVDKNKGKKESIHKILTPSGLVVTRALFSDDEDMVNISQNFIDEITANPGKLSATNEDTVKDYSKDPNQENETNEDDDSQTADCGSVYDSPITISEVFRGGDRYNPYVEFLIHEDVEREYDSLLLSGSLLTQPLTIDLDEETETYDREKLQKNTRLILTTKAGALTEAGLITIILHPDLKFNSFGGELELYGIDGQSRQLLDIVKIENGLPEKSTYTAGSNHRCGIIMDNVMDFSPGFDESALKYFSTTSKYNEKIVEKVKYVGGGGGCSSPSKEELCGTNSGNAVQTGAMETTPQPSAAPLTGSEISPLTGGVSQSDEGVDTKGQAIKIVSLESKSPESITLQSFLPYDIDFKNHNYYLKTSTATTKKYIDGILYSNTIDTFTKNFGFVDGGACVYLYSGDIQLDSHCYSSEKTEKESKEESDSFSPSDYQISITHIDYDPEGSDGGNETITIQSKSSQPLDLSKIKMKVNATNKKLTGILEPYSTLTLKGSFGFPNSTKDNSDVVVFLFYDNHIFSTYTYNPNKLKVEIPQGAVKVYSVIDGDTFRYRKEDGSLQSVRLLGVDAPESNTARYRSTECFGKEAKNYLTNLIKNQYVTLEFDSNSAQSDAYGRMLAYVYLDGKLVNETLISEGYAKEYTYKTSYTQQSAFKQAEENAKKAEKGLRSPAICGKSIEEEPEAWGIDYEKLSIKISNVIYDPDGTDLGNETVQLNVDNSQISAVSSIDFSDNFSLTIFPRSEYSTGTTKNKKLSEFGLLDIFSSGEITLKGNFGLPNNRATCVSLNQGSYTFDTRCYNPSGQLSDDEVEVQTGEILIFRHNVKIQSIVPNPSGKDSGKEEITLLWSPSENFQSMLDLSPDFSLLINGKTKKKLAGSLTPNQKITIKGSFSFPNSASCVSLLYKGEELDNFCYGKASDGVKFNSNNTSVREIPAEELAIVKKITLVRQGDKLCISYNKTKFSCKSIPNSTTEKNKKLLSMQNSYIAEIQKYLKNNYSMLYYNSQLKEYFDLYSDAKKTIKSGSGEFTRNDSNISVTNISSLFDKKYEKDAKDYFLEQIQGILSENLSLTLLQAEDEYTQKLVEKSDLGFLSLVE